MMMRCPFCEDLFSKKKNFDVTIYSHTSPCKHNGSMFIFYGDVLVNYRVSDTEKSLASDIGDVARYPFTNLYNAISLQQDFKIDKFIPLTSDDYVKEALALLERFKKIVAFS